MPQEKVKIYGEESAFNFPANFVVYYGGRKFFFAQRTQISPQH